MCPWLPALLFISACSGLTHFEEGPGSGPGTGGGSADAAPDSNDAGAQDGRILGTLCLIDDLADRGPCAPLTSSGLTVQAESEFAVAAADGSFDLAGPGRLASLVVAVTGDNTYVSAAVWIELDDAGGAHGIEIPIIGVNDLDNIVAGSGANHLGGSAVIVIRTDTQTNAPADSVAMTVIEGIDPIYDTADTNVYVLGVGTSTRGTGVYFDVVPQAASYSVGLDRDNFSGTVTVSAVADAVNIATAIVGN